MKSCRAGHRRQLAAQVGHHGGQRRALALRLQVDEHAAGVEGLVGPPPPTIEATSRRAAIAAMTASALLLQLHHGRERDVLARLGLDLIWPMSSCGKKPLGMSPNSQTVSRDGAEEDQQDQRLCPQAPSSGA